MFYDVIGDIHGQDAKLEALLTHLGYTPDGKGYRAPAGRQAVFLGDLIDRGPGQIRVLETVRAMVDTGQARCIMGNHEFNAVAFVTPDPRKPGECYRVNRIDGPKSRKNRVHHAEFLAQVGEGSEAHRSWVEWFRSLPVCLDLGGIRVVHGTWHPESVQALADLGWRDGVLLDDALMARLHEKDARGHESLAMRARKRLTCGLEIDLPEGKAIEKDGHVFDNLRIADWRHGAKTLREVALVPEGNESLLEGMEWPAELVLTHITGSPVFVGHHWFNGHPVVESPKLACLDWSAAKRGPLVAYRWDGEDELSNDKLVAVSAGT